MTAQTVALIVIALLVAISSPGAPFEGPPVALEDVPAIEITAEPELSDLYVLAYYMQDGARTARTSLEMNGHVVNGLSPWSWGLTTEGDLQPVYFTEQDLADVLAWSGRNNMETHVLVHNFDPVAGRFDKSIADGVLTEESAGRRAVEQIVQTARSWGVSGVHIDFEGVQATRRDDLTAFMERLRHRLSTEGIGLSIAVPAKTAATAHAPWTEAYDYAALARHVDFIVIMTYDEHWPGSSPGPVASMPWVRSVIEYALDPAGGNVPADRLVLGLAGYGYDWPLSGDDPGESVTFAEVSQRFNDVIAGFPAAEVKWHDEYVAPYFDYDGRRLWFENAQSLHYKLQLAQEFGLHGVALWRLGQEDPGLWPLLGAADEFTHRDELVTVSQQ